MNSLEGNNAASHATSLLCLNSATAIDQLFEQTPYAADEQDNTDDLTSLFMTTPLADCTIHQLEHADYDG